MATGNQTLNANGLSVATLEVREIPNTVELQFPSRGFLVNAGKNKVYVSVNSESGKIADVQQVGTVGVFPGGILPFPDLTSRFSYQTEKGRSVLYWIPGDNAPTVGDFGGVQKVNDGEVVELLSACKDLLAEIRDAQKKGDK